jgi:hypothetical protein
MTISLWLERYDDVLHPHKTCGIGNTSFYLAGRLWPLVSLFELVMYSRYDLGKHAACGLPAFRHCPELPIGTHFW